MKTKNLLAGALGTLALLTASLWAVKRWMEQPLFRPGTVRTEEELVSPLEPPPKAATQDGFVDMGAGVQLFTFERGQGPRALVLHGGPGFPNQGHWPGLEPLGDRFRFLYYHQRGAGRSTRPFDTLPKGSPSERMQLLHRTLGIPAQLADVERLRRVHGEKSLILVGHSFGAFLAALYATEFPERVRALVLIAPAPLFEMPPLEGGLLQQIERSLPADQRPSYEDFLSRYLDFMEVIGSDEASVAQLNREFVPFYRKACQAQGARDCGPAPMGNGGFVVQALYLSLGARHNWNDLAQAVSAPILVLHGALDLQSETASRVYLELFPQAEFHVFAESGHAPFEDQPEQFAQVVGEFLDRQ